ncbi:MAG: Holliday junction resolvase RecU [Cellulosilyticaceae bacterium]
MGYWNTRGLRGSVLEDTINVTNELYLAKNIGLIQKIPTPIKPITIDQAKRVITLAYFDQKSTVDYIGIVQGVSICFDAKETTKENLPLGNVHEHQIQFMEAFEAQGGIAFLIVYFKKYEAYYILTFEKLKMFYDNAKQGGRKSIPFNAFEEEYKILLERGMYLNYIKTLQKHLEK